MKIETIELFSTKGDKIIVNRDDVLTWNNRGFFTREEINERKPKREDEKTFEPEPELEMETPEITEPEPAKKPKSKSKKSKK